MKPQTLRDKILKFRRKFKFLPISKFRKFYREFKDREFTLLDIGCGNHSASLAKNWFPKCRYYGLDHGIYNNDKYDFDLMETFYDVDLSSSAMEEIPDELFDVIILNHVIEHLPNGLNVLKEVTGKLKPGGKLYVEFPSVKSLSLPNMKGTLNFCDDNTHVRLYDLREVANVLLAHDMRIIRGGTRREWWKILLFPLLALHMVVQGRPAGAFQDIMGFAEYVYAEKKVRNC